jgi:hypothetical protein
MVHHRQGKLLPVVAHFCQPFKQHETILVSFVLLSIDFYGELLLAEKEAVNEKGGLKKRKVGIHRKQKSIIECNSNNNDGIFYSSRRSAEERTDSSSREDGNAFGLMEPRASLASEEVFDEEEIGERDHPKMERKGKG